MMRVVYSLADGEVLAVYDRGAIPGPLAAGEAIMLAEYAEIGRHYIDLSTGDLLRRQSDDVLATWADIKSARDVLRESPIEIGDGRSFDANKDSFILFEDSIAEWDFFPAEALNSDGRLMWKMSNNDYTPCSKADLQAILAELRTKRAVRAALLQVKAEQLKASAPTIGELQQPATWGLD